MMLWPLLARFAQFCRRRIVVPMETVEGEQLIDRHRYREGSSARRPEIKMWYEEEPEYVKSVGPKNF
jgi:hypothetical protein